jgi:hypothetical protein
MKGLAVATGEGAVGRFLDERVTEQVGQVRLFLQKSDQAEGLQRPELGLERHGHGR